MPQAPAIGADVSSLMTSGAPAPAVGADVSALMNGGGSTNRFSDALDRLQSPTFAATNQKDASGNAVVDTGASGAIKGIGEGLTDVGLNPVADIEGVAQVVRHPEDTAIADTQRRLEPLASAQQAFQNGHYRDAAVNLLRYVLHATPSGGVVDAAAQEFANGEHAKAISHLLGFVGGLGGQVALMTPGASSPAAPNAAQAEIADLSDFAQRHGIKQSVADVTTNPVALKLQKVADNSLLGSGIAQRATGQTIADLDRAGADLAGQANPNTLIVKTATGQPLSAPGAPVGPTDAGAALRGNIQRRIEEFAQNEQRAYATADQLAQNAPATTRSVAAGQPFQSIRVPVDLRTAKAAIAPLYDEWTRQGQVAPLMGAKARAYGAMDRLMHAPDFVPIGVADHAASDLGAMAGHPEMPELRTAGQGAAARAFGVVRQQVDQAAAQVPGLQAALKAGRAATTDKWNASDVLDEVKQEPAQAFNKATAKGDQNIDYLQRVSQLAPDAVPALARAKLDQIIGQLNLGGAAPLDRAQGALRDWEGLGQQTKLTLFKDPGYIKELDRFFKLNARMARMPNPSGTALTHIAAAEAASYPTAVGTAVATGNPLYAALPFANSGFWGAVGKLMHSATGVRLVTRGLTLPAKSAAAATWATQVANALRAISPSALPAPVGAQQMLVPTPSGAPGSRPRP